MCVKHIALFYTLARGQSCADRSACTDRSISVSKTCADQSVGTFANEVNS